MKHVPAGVSWRVNPSRGHKVFLIYHSYMSLLEYLFEVKRTRTFRPAHYSGVTRGVRKSLPRRVHGYPCCYDQSVWVTTLRLRVTAWVTFWHEIFVSDSQSRRDTFSICALHYSFRPQEIKDRERSMHTDKCSHSQKT
jgi:hypothetical protein